MFKFLSDLFFSKSRYLRGTISTETEQKLKRDWEKIDSLVKGRTPSQLRQALITADRSLDTALKDICLGESMGERLKNSKEKFDRHTYSKIWEAHKMRNALVHEADYEPGYFAIEDSILNIRMALRKLKIYV